MAWSQSIFLQALGWATLNSFWQMGLLWCIYQLTVYFARPNSKQRYLQAAGSLGAGALWFGWTFYSYYRSGAAAPEFLPGTLVQGRSVLPMILSAASVAYMLLLAVPVVNVYRNWRYLQAIRTRGLGKAPVRYRLFVEKIGQHIGIRKSVQVYLSSLVTSPLTIGYFKPIILLPVAALSNLTPAQLEAVLLHELSHIRRYDYLVNLLLTAINVVLYFNPFVRLFIRAVETERENCCDELVLQFEYDKVAYASALLELEKSNHRTAAMAMAATHRNNLLSRVEKIVGIQKKPRINAQHIMGAFAALMLVLTLNAMVIKAKSPASASSGDDGFASAMLPYSFPAGERADHNAPLVANAAPVAETTLAPAVAHAAAPAEEDRLLPAEPAPATAPDFRTVAFDESAVNLKAEDVARVKQTVENTRKTLEAQWNTVAQNIPDGLTDADREAARREYLGEVSKINWQRFEQNLQSRYEKIDLDKVNRQMATEMAFARMDSIQTVYLQALTELDKLAALNEKGKQVATPLPDVSVSELAKVRATLEQKIAEIDELKGKGKKAKGGVTKL